jgi:hypothetical protein
MKKVIKKFWKWLVVSSENPGQVSMTIKGAGLLVIPQVVQVLTTLGLEVPETTLTANLETFVTAIGLWLTAFGLVRKVLNTSKKK